VSFFFLPSLRILFLGEEACGELQSSSKFPVAEFSDSIHDSEVQADGGVRMHITFLKQLQILPLLGCSFLIPYKKSVFFM